MAVDVPMRTEADFQVSFSTFIRTAQFMGVDTTVEANRAFIQFIAEADAEMHAQQRKIYKYLHPK